MSEYLFGPDDHAALKAAVEALAPAGSTVEVNAKPAPAGEIEQQLAQHDDRLARIEAAIDRLMPLLDTVSMLAEAADGKDAHTIEATHGLIKDILAAWKSHFGWAVPTST